MRIIIEFTDVTGDDAVRHLIRNMQTEGDAHDGVTLQAEHVSAAVRLVGYLLPSGFVELMQDPVEPGPYSVQVPGGFYAKAGPGGHRHIHCGRSVAHAHEYGDQPHGYFDHTADTQPS